MVIQSEVPEGLPKSGRIWKVKQRTRASAQLRTGFLKNLTKTREEREVIRLKKVQVQQLEKEMKEEKHKKIQAEKDRREQQDKRRLENEYKSSAYQVVCRYLFIHILPRLTDRLLLFIYIAEARKVEGNEQEAAPSGEED